MLLRRLTRPVRLVRALSVLAAVALTMAVMSSSAAATAKLGLWTPTQVNESVEKGVLYIDEHQNLSFSYGTSAPIAETGMALVAYSALAAGNWNNLPSSPRNYKAHVEKAITWLLAQQKTSGAWQDGGSFSTYSTGIALAGLGLIKSLTSLPPAVASSLAGPIAKGRSYLLGEFQGEAWEPLFCKTSSPAQYCDGWGYLSVMGHSDESNTGFAMFGLRESGGVPATIASENVKWQERIQAITSNPYATRNDGGGSYQPKIKEGELSSNANDSGSMLFGYGYDAVPVGAATVQAGIKFDQEVLNEYELETATRDMVFHGGATLETTCTIGSSGCKWEFGSDGGYHYSLFALTKGLGSYVPTSFTNPSNWWAKLVDLSLSQQEPDGAWPSNGRDDNNSVLLATAFTVGALGKSGVTTTKWLSNGKPIHEGQPVPVTTSGTLTFRADGGEIEIPCTLTDHETLTDPVGGGLATDEITEFNLSACKAVKAPVCGAGELLEVSPANLPWQTVLVGEADEIIKIKINIECNKGGLKTVVYTLTGSLDPVLTSTSQLEFTTKSGDLKSGVTPVEVLGIDQLMGPRTDERITGSSELPVKEKNKNEGHYTQWSECQTEKVAACLNATSIKGSTLQIGGVQIALKKPITLQGGINQHYLEPVENGAGGDDGELEEGVADTFEGAKVSSNTLKQVAEPAPRLEGLIEPAQLSEEERAAYEKEGKRGKGKVKATIELAAPASAIGIEENSLESGESAVLQLPVKIKWSNKFLGSSCTTGSTAEPIMLDLTTGTTSPPEGIEPLTGGLEGGALIDNGQALTFEKVTLVDNSYTAPAASGCGSNGGADQAIDAKLGLPSTPGQDAATINIKLGQATAAVVTEHGA